MKVLVLGGQTAGLEAAIHIKRNDPGAEVLVVEKLLYTHFFISGLPGYVAGDIHEEDMVFSTKDELEAEYGIQITLGTRAVGIDPEKKEVKLLESKTGLIYKTNYDKLILATGVFAKKLEVFENVGKGVFIMKNLTNANRLKKYIERNHAKKAVIVGGGNLGLEMAEAMNVLGLEVTLVEKADRIRKKLTKNMSDKIQDHILQYIDLELSSEVIKATKVDGPDKKVVIKNAEGKTKELTAHVIIVACGYTPSNDYILSSDMEMDMDVQGYVLVNEKMQTNVKDIYAVGDLTRIKSIVLDDTNFITSNSTSAKKQALVAANNIIGRDYNYRGTTHTLLSSVFGLTIARVGLTEHELKLKKVDYYSITLSGYNSVKQIEGAKKIIIEGFFEEKTNKFLGAILIGNRGVDKKVDVLATCITAGFTAKDLEMLELSYSPQFNTIKDIINILGKKSLDYSEGRV